MSGEPDEDVPISPTESSSGSPLQLSRTRSIRFADLPGSLQGNNATDPLPSSGEAELDEDVPISPTESSSGSPLQLSRTRSLRFADMPGSKQEDTATDPPPSSVEPSSFVGADDLSAKERVGLLLTLGREFEESNDSPPKDIKALQRMITTLAEFPIWTSTKGALKTAKGTRTTTSEALYVAESLQRLEQSSSRGVGGDPAMQLVHIRCLEASYFDLELEPEEASAIEACRQSLEQRYSKPIDIGGFATFGELLDDWVTDLQSGERPKLLRTPSKSNSAGSLLQRVSSNPAGQLLRRVSSVRVQRRRRDGSAGSKEVAEEGKW